MRDEAVCQPGLAWWFQALFGLGATVLGIAALTGWIEGEIPYGHLGTALMVLGGGAMFFFAITGWRRFRATPRGLVRERVGSRDLVPWSEFGRPDTHEIQANPIRQDLQQYMGHGVEQGMHITTYRDRDGRVLCHIGPRFANRRAFGAAVRKYVRAARE